MATEKTLHKMLADQFVRCKNITMRKILTHLLTHYGDISPAKLQENNEKLKKAGIWPSHLLHLLTRLRKQLNVSAGGEDHSAQHVINNAYTVLHKTGVFFDACRC